MIEGDVAYIWWVAEMPDNRYELGTDTFFVRHGKIAVQTFAFKPTPRPDVREVNDGLTLSGLARGSQPGPHDGFSGHERCDRCDMFPGQPLI